MYSNFYLKILKNLFIILSNIKFENQNFTCFENSHEFFLDVFSQIKSAWSKMPNTNFGIWLKIRKKKLACGFIFHMKLTYMNIYIEVEIKVVAFKLYKVTNIMHSVFYDISHSMRWAINRDPYLWRRIQISFLINLIFYW